MRSPLARPLALSLLLFGCSGEPVSSSEAPPASSSEAPLTAAPLTDKREVEARRKALFTQIRAWVHDLEEAGRYDCCVATPCSHCAILAGGCACGEGLRRGEPVCEECAMMWAAGQGAEPGVDPADVRSFLEASRPRNAAGAQRVCEHDNVGTAGADPNGGASSTP